MRLVVNISDDVYKDIKSGYIQQEYANECINAIKNGVSLCGGRIKDDYFSENRLKIIKHLRKSGLSMEAEDGSKPEICD